MQPYTKRTWTEINLDCLEHNYHQIKALLPQTDIIATVKADGYGPVSYTHLDVYKRQVLRYERDGG